MQLQSLKCTSLTTSTLSTEPPSLPAHTVCAHFTIHLQIFFWYVPIPLVSYSITFLMTHRQSRKVMNSVKTPCCTINSDRALPVSIFSTVYIAGTWYLRMSQSVPCSPLSAVVEIQNASSLVSWDPMGLELWGAISIGLYPTGICCTAINSRYAQTDSCPVSGDVHKRCWRGRWW